MLRFVILHHTGYGDEHWDLMLENQGTLLTWKLGENPVKGALLPIKAVRIGDHRSFYLDYEGPVSGDRGHVTREEQGWLTWLVCGPDVFAFVLAGHRLNGEFRLTRAANAWLLDRVDAPFDPAADVFSSKK